MQLCPQTGFPLFKEEFSLEEIKTMQAFVRTSEYKTLRARHTDYYVTAVLQQQLNEPADVIAWSILSAAWEAEEKQPKLERLYLQEAHKRFVELAAATDRNDAKWPVNYFLSIELARRLGRFDEAGRRFVAERDALEKAMPAELIEMEAQLIMAQETKPDSPFNRLMRRR